MKNASRLSALLGLWLLVAGTAPVRAQTEYTIRPIAKLGDVAADFTIHDKLRLQPTVLADDGRLIFAAYAPDGSEGDRWFQWKEGVFTVIARPGSEYPDGVWPDRFWSAAWVANQGLLPLSES